MLNKTSALICFFSFLTFLFLMTGCSTKTRTEKAEETIEKNTTEETKEYVTNNKNTTKKTTAKKTTTAKNENKALANTQNTPKKTISTMTTKEKKINSIQINKDNWNIFFELSDIAEWDYNDFNEADGVRIGKYFRLKEKYYGKIAQESKIAFQYDGIIKDKLLIVDFSNKKYSIKEKTWTGGLGKGQPKTDTNSIVLSKNNYKVRSSLYSCHDGYYIIDGEKVLTVNILEDVKMTRVEGTLYIYEQDIMVFTQLNLKDMSKSISDMTYKYINPE